MSACSLLGNYSHGFWEKECSVIKEGPQAQAALIDFLMRMWNFHIQSYTSDLKTIQIRESWLILLPPAKKKRLQAEITFPAAHFSLKWLPQAWQ